MISISQKCHKVLRQSITSKIIVFLFFDYLMPTPLITTRALWQHGWPAAENLLCHWPSKAGMLPQNHGSDEEDERSDKDGRTGLSSYFTMYLRSLLCLLCP